MFAAKKKAEPKPCHKLNHLFQFRFQLSDDALLQSGYVGLGDSNDIGNFFLGAFLPIPQAKAESHDDPFPLSQTLNGFQNKTSLYILLNSLVDSITVCAENIGEKHFVSVPVDIQRLVNGNFLMAMLVLSQEHQNLILDTAGSIGSKLDVFLRAEGVYGFDQSNGTDGDQILNAYPTGFKFSCDIYHQPQIVCDQLLASMGFFLRQFKFSENDLFFFSAEWRRQNFGTVDVMDFLFREKTKESVSERIPEMRKSSADVNHCIPNPSLIENDCVLCSVSSGCSRRS